jgi:hypothetical protein
MIKKISSLDYKFILHYARYLAIALLGTIIITSVVGIISPNDPRNTTVIIAKGPIEIGEEITKDNTQEYRVTEDIAPIEGVSLEDMKEDLKATAKISRGMIITKTLAQTNTSKLLAKNKVAQIISLPDSINSEIFSPGTEVNLLGKGEKSVLYLAKRAKILPQTTFANESNRESKLLVEVTVKESENISSFEKTITPVIVG